MSLQDIVEPEKVEELLVTHLKENKIFHDGPRSWTIRYSSLGGRGIFATRDIEQNELIFIDAPLLIGPRCAGKQLQMCVCCYKNECPLFPCDRGCGLPVCSVQCENSPMHIELLKKNVTNLPNEKDLELMKRVCEVFNTNSFETVSVHDKDHSTSLRSLYPMGALQNHCCVPNTRHHFDGEFRLYVTAALPISAGEEITMTYTRLFWDTTLRRNFLSLTKHFSCACRRCSDPTEFGSKLGALLCAHDSCFGELLPRNPLNLGTSWVCNKCSTTINYRQIYSIRSGIAAIMEENLYKTPRQIYKFMQKELSVVVPWSNYFIIDVKFRIVSCYGRSDGLAWEDLTDTELDIKAKYCNDLLSVIDALNCGDCKKRGLLLYELYCTNLEKIKRLQQQQNMEKVNENQHLLEKAVTILQNDILSTANFQYDQKYFKQLITV
ncbi:Protein msta, isoform A [Habropoda laboriosa]|uniref:Protein msta, isoform A n=1 Tax=Habropoda laboriosa TaxID=597456 RepID=A0A0L7RA61_9HYME|nr:Protein msta, isoform A [Habropoda laboriosa]